MAERVTPDPRPAAPPKKNRSEYPLDQHHRRRMRAVFWMFLGGFTLVALKLISIHVWPNFPLSDNTGKRDIPIARGRIYDTDGGILARDRLAPSLWANPGEVRDPYQAAEYLSAKLGLDQEEVYQRLTKTNAEGAKLQFVWVKRWLSEEEHEGLGDVGDIGAGGLAVKREFTRTYPEKQLASHVIGFANREQRGCEGIEAKYDRYLFGAAGKQRTRVDAQRRLRESSTVERIAPEGGADV
ncbi:MAG: hypothetical protein GY851_30900, partial [bacterium]|nr:hypothetical protein [bacterium]